MATPKQVTEPAAPVARTRVTEPASVPPEETRAYDPNHKVRVQDKATKTILNRLVPETWLDGRFPNLEEAPAADPTKEGK